MFELVVYSTLHDFKWTVVSKGDPVADTSFLGEDARFPIKSMRGGADMAASRTAEEHGFDLDNLWSLFGEEEE